MSVRRRMLKAGAMFFAGMMGAWIFPPVYSAVKGLCPARPTGVSEAAAVPNFARANNLACVDCHTAWPLLNETGRQFKINGYKVERGKTADAEKEVKGQVLSKAFAMSGAIAKLRPYDKKVEERAPRHRPFHELELFVAGDVGGDYSVFGEIEMEDEPDAVTDSAGDDEGEFTPKIGELAIGWHPSEYANVVLGYRGFLVMDPYQTFTGMGSPTNNARSSMVLGGDQQTTMLYGEVGKEELGVLYYAAGVTSDKGSSEGKAGNQGNLRIALDTTRGVMVGAFGQLGRGGQVGCTAASCRTNTKAAGVDALVELGGLTARGVFAGYGSEDSAPASNVNAFDRLAYLELLYPIRFGNRMVVPTLRQDWQTKKDGDEHLAAISAQLAYYPRPNVKAFLEYWSETTDQVRGTGAVTSGRPKSHRVQAQINIGF